MLIATGNEVVLAFWGEKPAFATGQRSFSLYSQRKWKYKPIILAFDVLRFWLQKDIKVDFILSTDESGVLFSAWASKVLGVPLVIMGHGTYVLRCHRTLYPGLHRCAYRHATAIFISSRYTKRCFNDLVPELTNSTHVLRLGNREGSAHGTNPCFTKRKNSIVTVGAVKERKGLMVLLEALSRMAPETRPLLHVVGTLDESPGYVKKIKQKVVDGGLINNVLFTGQISDEELHSLYRESRLFVLPSQNTAQGDFEGFGLVHLEAQSFGLPAIGSLDCGNEDVISDNVTGFLIPQTGSVAELLSDRISDLLFDEELWTSFSNAAVKFAASFTWENAFDSIQSSVTTLREKSN